MIVDTTMNIPYDNNNDPWCLQQHYSFASESNVPLCIRRSILDGILPSCVALISLAFLIVSIKNRSCRKLSKEKKPPRASSSKVQFGSITDAENSVISDKVYRAGLAWGGLSLLSNSDKSIKLPRCQIIKNVAVVCLCAANVILLAFKLVLSRNPGSNWLYITCATWAYALLLSMLRVNLPRSKPLLSPVSIDKHIIPFLLMFTCISFIDLRGSVLDHYKKPTQIDQKHIILTDALVFGFTSLCFVLELFTPRPSSYDYSESEKSDTSSPTERTPLLVDSHARHERIDQEEKINHPRSFEIHASLFSKYFFTFIDNFMIKYWRTKPKPEEMPDLRPDDLTASVLQRYRRDTAKMKNRALGVRLFWFFRHDLLEQILWSIPKPLFSIFPSLLLKILLDAISARGTNDPNAPAFHVVILALFLMPVCQIIDSIITSQTLIIGRRACIRIKSILEAEVFAKALRNSEQNPFTSDSSENNDENENENGNGTGNGVKKATAGKIQVMVANDLYRISEVAAYLNWLFTTPLTIILVVTLLFKVLGIAALAGLITSIFFLLVTFVCGQRFLVHQDRMRVANDERIKLATEAIQAIKTLKFFSWEEKFLDKMRGPREAELSEIIKRSMWLICQVIVLTAGPNVIAAVSFGVHTMILKRDLTASIAFTSLSLFNVLRDPLDTLADMTAFVLESYISTRRIDEYLNETETEKFDILKPRQDRNLNNTSLGFEEAEFIWRRQQATDEESHASDDFILNIGTVLFPVGKLTIITGPVGSGKTSLLLALLGEMTITNGKVFLPCPPMRSVGPPGNLTDTVAYCAQTPWLLSASLKENILFGLDYDEHRYAEVIRACALEPDIASLDLGDLTEVGEKGTVLSGGQKARICLARALYSPAKVLLLDDVLSAVDSHTADHLHDNCFQGPLMQDRTCILVTHAVTLCSSSSTFAVCMQGGEVKCSGSPEELGLVDASYIQSRAASIRANKRKHSKGSTSKKAKKSDKQYSEEKIKHLKLIKEEEQSTGAVSFEVYKLYAKCFGGYPAWLTTLMINIFAQIVDISLQWWLRTWAQSYSHGGDDGDTSPFRTHITTLSTILYPTWSTFNDSNMSKMEEVDKTAYYLKIYSALTILTFLLYSARMVQFTLCGIKASRVLYDSLIRRIMGAKVRFFDTTPVGRILNRLSKDIEEVDDDLPSDGMFMMMEMLWTIGITGAIAMVIPGFLIAAIFIMCIYAAIAIFYLGSSREVKRLESVTRSPMFGMFGEAMTGVTTIRAYADTGRFLSKMCDYIDNTNRPFFLLWLANRWLSVRIDITSALVTLTTAVAVLFQASNDAATAGFVLSFALLFQEKLLWVIRNVAKLEISINSVERIREYLEIDQEKKEGIDPPAAWPSREGMIKVQNLCVRYDANYSRVLHEVSFDVEPRQKVGIVGRTGSGKSTLALSFFRFVEAEEGCIIIDGLDIKDIKLSELRSRVVILPQDATLFHGTVRFNLDPFDQHDDFELWDALHKVGMGPRTPTSTPALSRISSRINTRPGSATGSTRSDDDESDDDDYVERHIISSLDMSVEDGGRNFSAGQRQLLALARGLLRLARSSIVILDEASASLDSKTDEQVQRTIREEMGDATLLCIAHRLRTIMEFDKVLVLGDGKVMEYGEPATLLEDANSAFSELCERTGEAKQLKDMASAAQVRRKMKITSW